MADLEDLLYQENQRRRMRYAEALMTQGASAEPVQHWTQGLARLGQAAVGGWLGYQDDQKIKEEQDKRNKAYAGLIQSEIDAEKFKKAPALPAASPSSPPVAPPPVKNPNIAESANRFLDNAFWGPPPAESQGLAYPPGTHFGVRNNNPMNIMGDPTALGSVYPGITGKYETKPGMSYLKFGTPEAGIAAAAQTLKYWYGKGYDTPEKMMGKLAPNVPGHGNDPAAYARIVATALGVKPGDKVDFSNPAVLQRVLPTIFKTETGSDGYTPEMVGKALNAPGAAPGIPPNAPPAGIPASPDGKPTNEARVAMLNKIKALVSSGDPTLRALGLQLFAKATTEDEKTTDDIREYNMAVKQGYKGTLQDWITAIKQAGASKNVMTVDQRGESEFSKTVAKNQAERFDKIVQGGTEAKTMVAQIQALRELSTKFDSGKGAELKAALGPYAEMLGVKIDGLDAVQAYKAIISRLAPQMRVPGSGATSDFEMRTFLEALPGLGKTPQGNEIISRTLDAISQHKIAAAEIASRAMAGEITAREAEKQLRNLPDPLALWKKSGKSLIPAAPSAAPPSAAPPGRIRRYNPSTGAFE